MLTINGEEYELKYTIKRLDMIESTTGKSLMAELSSNNGMLSLLMLKIVVGYGIKKIDGGHMSPQHGMELAEKLLVDLGYAKLVAIVVENLERDCPFLFQVD